MMLTVPICRAARGALGWSIEDLARAAEVGVMTVHRFEGGQTIRLSSINKLVSAFTTAGLTFVAAGEASSAGGDGLRFS